MGAIGEWERGPVIGRGASATVSIATDRRTGLVFAVKSVEAARAGALRHEQRVLSALSSPHVVSCLGSGLSTGCGGGGGGGGSVDLFLEYAPGGSLADEIKRRGGRCEEAVIRWRAHDVLRGLAHAHAAGVAHCDVKARNVLLGADGRAMLADFGCARWTAAEGAKAAAGGVRGGTPAFMSPEAARGEAQGPAADVWALGCTVIEMATGGPPWARHRFADPVAALRHVAWSGEAPEAPAWLSREGKDFLSRCLARDPAARWTAEQLLAHPFVASCAAASGGPALRWVSPKSVLDQQGLWEDEEEEEEEEEEDNSGGSEAATAAADRVGALAGAAAGAEWTWSGEIWITVTGAAAVTNSGGGDHAAAAPAFEADAAAGSGASASGRSTGVVGENTMGVGGDAGGPADGDAGVSRCNHVIISRGNSECCSRGGNKGHSCSAINSNRELSWLTNSRPSWLLNNFWSELAPPRPHRRALAAVLLLQLLGVGSVPFVTCRLTAYGSRLLLRARSTTARRACVETSRS